VKVENLRGSVRAEAWEGQAVRVVAEKKEPKGAPILPTDLMLMSANGDVVIKCNQAASADRIDLTIYLPAAAHIQITTGTYPIEVNGLVGSAVIQTTSGDIGYHLPPSAGARVSMHSARGVVRAALALNVDDRVGLHTLQGTIGDGGTPVMLDSKSGNITLLPGAGTRHVVAITDGQNGRADLGYAQAPAQTVERAPAADNGRAGSAQARAYNDGQDYTASQRRGGLGANDDPRTNQDPDDTVAARQDPGSVLIQSPTPSSRIGGPAPSTNNEMVFGGSGGSTHGSSVTKFGGIPRPSQTDITQENSSGLKVRIIPSDATAGGSGDPRYPNRRNVDRLYAPDDQDQAGDPAAQEPAPGSSRQTPASGMPGMQSSSNQNSAPGSYPSSGEVSLGGSGNSNKGSSVTKFGGVPRPSERDITSENSSGLKVRIIPADSTAGGSGDPRYPDRKSYDRIYSDPGEPAPSQGAARSASGRTEPDPGAQPVTRGASSPTTASSSGAAASGDDTRSLEPPPPPVDTAAANPRAGRDVRPARAKASDDAIVLTSSLVSMNVSVTDRAGKTLAGLKKEDFKIAENGEEQQVEFFAPSTAPFNLVLLLDLSGSITDKIEVVKSAALHFLDAVGPEDKVAVVTFTREPTVISNLTNNRDLLRKRIKAIKKPEGGTAFYEAVWFTLVDTLRGTEGQRNAIVIMSDGVDNSLERFNPAHSRVSFDQLARKLRGSDSIVFPIYLDTEYEEVFERGNSSSESYAIARDQLAMIADITGGRLFQAQHPEDLAGVYNQVAEALRTVYSVGYYPTNGQRDGSFRRVSVGVDQPGVVVRSRKGYYAR
jgi:VWFA-related protein